MKIEHIALYVEDLEETKNFFIKYLGRNQTKDTIIPRLPFVPIFFPSRMVPDLRSCSDITDREL